MTRYIPAVSYDSDDLTVTKSDIMAFLSHENAKKVFFNPNRALEQARTIISDLKIYFLEPDFYPIHE
jgi:queuine/archaeosine tRNA-ribosyltransferase